MGNTEVLFFFLLGISFGYVLQKMKSEWSIHEPRLSDYLDFFPLTEHHLDLMIQMYPNNSVVGKDSNANLMSALWVKKFIEVHDFYVEGTSYRLSRLGETVCAHHKKTREQSSSQFRS